RPRSPPVALRRAVAPPSPEAARPPPQPVDPRVLVDSEKAVVALENLARGQRPARAVFYFDHAGIDLAQGTVIRLEVGVLHAKEDSPLFISQKEVDGVIIPQPGPMEVDLVDATRVVGMRVA